MGLGIYSVLQLPICFQSKDVKFTDIKVPLFSCPLACGAHADGVPQGEAQIKTSLRKSAITWPPMIPPGTCN